MSKLSDFVGGGGGLKPFNDLGTVTGTVNLDVSEFGSFRVKQGAGAITLNVTGKAADTAGYVELFFYPDAGHAVTISGADLVENGFKNSTGRMKSLTYENIFYSIPSTGNSLQCMTFNNDQSKMYLGTFNQPKLREYTLSTPGDVRTASFVSEIYILSPMDFIWNADGTILYVLTLSDDVHAYNFSTGFEISTLVSVSNAFSVTPQEPSPKSIRFNFDFSSMYILGVASNATRVFQYTLSTPGNILTASYTTNSQVINEEAVNGAYSIEFNKDFSKMYLVGVNTDFLYEYPLSTPGEINTLGSATSAFATTKNSDSESTFFSQDKSKLYIFNERTERVEQYATDYQLGPLFKYQIIHTGTAATFNTLDSDYSIEVTT